MIGLIVFHRFSCELHAYTRDLLAYGFINKEVAHITSLGKNAVKDIVLKRLKEKYTVDGERLIQPERQARYLGNDEFKLPDGHKYAVIIIDMETGPCPRQEESQRLFVHRTCREGLD